MSDKPQYSREEVASHNTKGDAWIIIDGKIYDVTKFSKAHPGGTKMLLDVAGTDASSQFNTFHTRRVLEKFHPKLHVGDLKDYTAETTTTILPENAFGEMVPYADPCWYQGWKSPYYNDSHIKFRAAVRQFVDTEFMPNASQWLKDEEVPREVVRKMADVGLLQCFVKGRWLSEYYGDNIIGGVKPEEYDWFHFLIAVQEFSRVGSIGLVWACTVGINIGLAPVINFGDRYLKDLIVRDVANARKFIALAITEPWAGSDVANLQTRAELTPDGKHYIVNGAKKWISNGMWADYFTTCVRTGGDGMNGLTLLLIERKLEGVTVKRMDCQGAKSSGTAYIVFEDVKVPVENRIGKEGKGFKYVMKNFNTERFYLLLQGLSSARVCFEDAFKYANKRKTFGKKLIEHPVIRNKFANMIRELEALQAWVETTAYQLNNMTFDEQVKYLAGSIGMMKAHSTRVFELCAREAMHVFGGLGYTRNGQGERVERLYRDVRSITVPGGAEEVLLDLGVRQAQRRYPKDAKL